MTAGEAFTDSVTFELDMILADWGTQAEGDRFFMEAISTMTL